MEIYFKTNPHKAVSFVQSSVQKALDNAGYLMAGIKYDGVRGNIVVDNTAEGLWLSRVSKTIPALEHLNGFSDRWQRLLRDDRCIFPDGFMLDGELMVKGVDFNTGSGLLRSKWLHTAIREFDRGDFPAETISKAEKIRFELDPRKLQVVLYGVMPFDSMVSGETYDTMHLLMREHVKVMLPLLREYLPEIQWELEESFEVYDMDSLTELYEAKRSEGHEGLVAKDPMGLYQRGKKSGMWKMKPEKDADGIIQGVNWGTPGLANEGKVIGFRVLLETGRLVDANNISRALMDEFTSYVKEASLSAFGVFSPYGMGASAPVYLNPYEGWACQISYMEETPDGSLRHPSFEKFRGTEDNPQEKM